jgi:hypothetical protein
MIPIFMLLRCTAHATCREIRNWGSLLRQLEQLASCAIGDSSAGDRSRVIP